MDSLKVGSLIKELRKRDGLSQQQFASKYGVTYQAVSKWENGKNIPDLAILKQICSDYDVDLNDLLEARVRPKRKVNLALVVASIAVLIIGGAIIFKSVVDKKKDNFEFKTLSSSCSEFTLYGSIAYNADKTSIYIPNVTYCGGDDVEKYKDILCILYENEGNTKREISKYTYDKNDGITLEEFLKELKFNVDNYEKTCKTFKENSLELVIEAVSFNDKMVTYRIPLSLDENCKN